MAIASCLIDTNILLRAARTQGRGARSFGSGRKPRSLGHTACWGPLLGGAANLRTGKSQ
jgi:hypothetical protein